MKPELFGTFDLLIGFGWLVIIFGLSFWYYLSKPHIKHYKWFLPNLSFRVLFGLLFALAYSVILTEGGDTLAYHDGAYHLSNLFWERPLDYFLELMTTPTSQTISERFSETTGYPPSWIYREPESFFISKVMSIFSIITFNSFAAMTILCATFSALASWRLFTTLKGLQFCPKWIVVVSTMFIPTVAFWCSGISKDTFVLGSFYYVFSYLFPVFFMRKRITFNQLIGLAFFSFILFHTRSFMLIAIALPLLSALLVRWGKIISDNLILINVYRLVIAGVILLSLSIYSQGSLGPGLVDNNEILNEVVVIQKDFAQNKLYTGYRYDLGIEDYSAWGLLKATPIAIITAFFRPFLWEANSAFLIISGLESTLLIILALKFFFFSGKFTNHISYIHKQEFLVFAILFALVFGFFVGFTSGLFNVLVRFKAPILVFVIIYFASKKPKKSYLE